MRFVIGFALAAIVVGCAGTETERSVGDDDDGGSCMCQGAPVTVAVAPAYPVEVDDDCRFAPNHVKLRDGEAVTFVNKDSGALHEIGEEDGAPFTLAARATHRDDHTGDAGGSHVCLCDGRSDRAILIEVTTDPHPLGGDPVGSP